MESLEMTMPQCNCNCDEPCETGVEGWDWGAVSQTIDAVLQQPTDRLLSGLTVNHGDPGYYDVWRGLWDLHLRKSSTYGVEDEKFSNFVAVAQQDGVVPEKVVLYRILEKAHRALNMIKSGQDLEVKEYVDMASLAIIAEALRCRRI